MKKIIFSLILLTGFTSFAQNNFSDETIQKFADAYIEVRNENMAMHLNMVSAIEKAGLTNEEFTNLHIRLNDKNAQQLTAEEKSKYDNALKNINSLNKNIQKSIEQIIESKGLKLETYQSIAEAYATDEALKEKIQKLIN